MGHDDDLELGASDTQGKFESTHTAWGIEAKAKAVSVHKYLMERVK